MEEQKTFYEKQRERERNLHAYVHNIDEDSQEAWKILEDYHAKGCPNTTDHYKLFYDKLILNNREKPAKEYMAPFFETTWLLLTLNEDLKPKEQAVSDLVRFFDEKFKGRLTYNFEAKFGSICKQGNALSYKRFKHIINASRDNKPSPELYVDNYRKIVSMLALYSASSRDHTLWTEAAKIVTPGINNILTQAPQEEMEADARLRTSTIGNIGTVVTPVYMPFIAINMPAFVNNIYYGLNYVMKNTPACRAARVLRLPLLYTHSIIMTAALETKQPLEGISPAVRLSKLFEVTENQRRKIS